MRTRATSPGQSTADVVLVGGGLANALIAWRLAELRPGLGIALVERGRGIGGNHTWSFHTTDVSAATLAWLRPLIERSWPDQEVRFPSHQRVLSTGYHCITSGRLHRQLTERLGPAARLEADVAEVLPDRIRLALGEEITAPLVIDGRGALAEQPLAAGYQKFVGLEIETAEPHGLARPIIMDATVAQTDGFRFLYTLPFTATRLLIEDTAYSDTPALDPPRLEREIEDYAASRGWRIARTLREEHGVLAVTLAGDIDLHWATLGRELPRSGLRAWLFHPTTGYSLPMAARIADAVAREPRLTSASIATLIEKASRAAWRAQAFFRLLNRMLFLAASPEARVAVLERFYRLPQPLIERFYAGEPTAADKARILLGRPPMPLGRALRCLGAGEAWAFGARHRPSPAGFG